MNRHGGYPSDGHPIERLPSPPAGAGPGAAETAGYAHAATLATEAEHAAAALAARFAGELREARETLARVSALCDSGEVVLPGREPMVPVSRLRAALGPT